MKIIKRIFNSLLGKQLTTYILNPTAVFEKPCTDFNRYIVTCRSKVTLVGKIKVTDFKPVLMNDAFTSDVEELLENRFSKEPFFYRGSREELMEAVPSLTNSDFDNCEQLESLRLAKIRSYIAQVTAPNRTIIHTFKHWLRTQVDLGVITDIDGYVFVNSGTLVKNCETGDFIYKYYDSWRKAHDHGLIASDWDSAAHLASHIMQRITESAFGIDTVDIKTLFTSVNVLLQNDTAEAFKDMELKRMTEVPLDLKLKGLDHDGLTPLAYNSHVNTETVTLPTAKNSIVRKMLKKREDAHNKLYMLNVNNDKKLYSDTVDKFITDYLTYNKPLISFNNLDWRYCTVNDVVYFVGQVFATKAKQPANSITMVCEYVKEDVHMWFVSSPEKNTFFDIVRRINDFVEGKISNLSPVNVASETSPHETALNKAAPKVTKPGIDDDSETTSVLDQVQEFLSVKDIRDLSLGNTMSRSVAMD